MLVIIFKLEVFLVFLWCVFICYGFDSIGSLFNGQFIFNNFLFYSGNVFFFIVVWKILLYILLKDFYNIFIGDFRFKSDNYLYLKLKFKKKLSNYNYRNGVYVECGELEYYLKDIVEMEFFLLIFVYKEIVVQFFVVSNGRNWIFVFYIYYVINWFVIRAMIGLLRILFLIML